jgi:hypothetical protein
MCGLVPAPVLLQVRAALQKEQELVSKLKKEMAAAANSSARLVSGPFTCMKSDEL